MSTAELTGAVWRKSSRSNGQYSCVEVAFTHNNVALRDSKNTPGPTITLTPLTWSALLETLK